MNAPDGKPDEPHAPQPQSNAAHDQDRTGDDLLGGDDQPPPAFQFGLRALFALTFACSVYFTLERMTKGRFALVSLGGAALALGVGLPLLWAAMGIVKLAFDGGLFAAILVAAGIAAAVLLALSLFPGF